MERLIRGMALVGAALPTGPRGGDASLASIYARLLPVGAAVEAETLDSQADLLIEQVNGLVAENDMKWERIHPRAGNDASAYDFARADAIARFADDHTWPDNFPVKGRKDRPLLFDVAHRPRAAFLAVSEW